MVESILDSVKSQLGLSVSDTSFDDELLIHINSAFTSLDILGLPGAGAFSITDNVTEWSTILPVEPNQNHVKTYVFLKVKLIFDTPQNSFLVKAIEDQIEKLESLIQIQAENAIILAAEEAVT